MAYLAVAYTAFAVYGSLVPLRFQALDWATAVERFRQIPLLYIDPFHRADLAANVLLFIPLAFCWTGVAAGKRRDAMALCAAAVVVAGCWLLSLAIEFTQLWFPERTTSWNDIIAESSGAVIGAALWLWLGRAFAAWLSSWTSATTQATRVDKLLAAYCFCLVVYSVLPMDLTISLTELYDKYQAGRVNFVPFAQNRPLLSLQSVNDLLRDIVIYVPLGALAYRWLINVPRPRREWLSILLSMAVVAATECLQVIEISRYADVTDLITGLVGVSIGVVAAKRYDHRQAAASGSAGAASAGWRSAWSEAGLLAVWSLVLCGTAWYPFEFNFDRHFIKDRVQALAQAPMTTLYYSSEMWALTNSLRHILWFVPIGVLIDRLARGHARSREMSRALLAMMLLGAAGLAVVLEMGQLAIPARTASFDGVWLRVLGALGGIAVSRWLAGGSKPRECAGVAVPAGAATVSAPRLAGLDGLRALAAATVILENLTYFAALPEWQAGPFELKRFAFSGVGVCLLFVMSGYLLTRNYWRSPHDWDAWRRPHRYVAGRVLRIAPAYLLCLCALIVLLRHWRTRLDAIDSALHLVALHNLTEFSFYGISDPFWTIAVQVQFYVLLPLVMWAAHRAGRRPAGVFVALLGLSAACYAAHVAIMSAAGRVDPWPFDRTWLAPDGFVLSKSTLAHLPIFLLGCALGYVASKLPVSAPSGVARGCRMVAFWAAVALVAAMTATPCRELLSPAHARFGYPLLPAALAVVVLLVRDSGIVRLLELAPVRWFGLLSYGIFIYHFTCLKIAATFADVTGIAWLHTLGGIVAVGGSLTLIIAALSYYLVEEPLVRRLGAERRARAPGVAAARTA
jgi:peptidoglycan/LPS O-acetylase OafA/YrhL/glycopeptide antibiotics resistance protein